MNAPKYILSLLTLTFFFSAASVAQNQLAVPLSNPGQPGKLQLGVVRGSIMVTGYEGKEVLIRYNGEGEQKRSKSVTPEGLRRISNNTVGFEVKEDDNVVEIGGVSPRHNISFEISVPHNFSLELSTVNGGDVVVQNVRGEMEISNVNGEVTLTNVSGSAVVNTVNGDIKATFNRINPDKPMAFSNLNGDIDVTLPADAKLSAKMKSEWGEVFTDFEMEINRTDKNRVAKTAESDSYRLSVNNWIYGSINGGGPEYLFKSMRGDIYIRKQ